MRPAGGERDRERLARPEQMALAHDLVDRPRPQALGERHGFVGFRGKEVGHTRDLVTKTFFAKGADPQLVNKIAYDMSLSPPKVGIPSLRATLEYDYAGPLKDVSVPVVAINSDLGEPTNEVRIRKVLPKFHAVTLAGDGHFLMMEDPGRFNPALEAEIQQMLAGS